MKFNSLANRTLFAVSVALLTSTLSTKAATITVPNFSFEDGSGHYTNTPTSSTAIPNWTTHLAPGGDAWSVTPAQVGIPLYPTNGSHYLFTGAEAGTTNSFSTNSSLGLITDATYTLSVDLGRGSGTYPTLGTYTIALVNETTLAVLAFNTLLSSSINPTNTFQSFSLAYTPTIGFVGTNLGIELSYTSTGLSNSRGYFDNVQLSAVPVPEPSTYVLVEFGLMGLVALIRFRKLNSL
jgi:hypothetical protein